MWRVIWIVWVVACSGKPPAVAPAASPPADAGPAADAAPLDQDLPRLVERSLAMYDAIGKVLAASGQDCAAATAGLDRLAADYRDVVQANARVLRDGRARELRAELDRHGEAFDASAQAIVQSPVMAKCSQDPAFARAFDELLEAPP